MEQYEFCKEGELPSLQKLLDEFGGQPTDGVLHIIVRVSTRGKSPTHLICNALAGVKAKRWRMGSQSGVGRVT